MAIRIKQNSRLRFADLVKVDGIAFWDMVELPDIPPQPDDILYTVRSLDRIDFLAHRFYGDPVLWWVIAVANDFEILPTDFDLADQIIIPSPRYVQQVLFSDQGFV